MGRPTKKTNALIEEICQRLSEGETLSDICRSDHMPDRRTVGNWQLEDDDVFSRIARARDIGCDVIADDTLKIIDAEPERVTITIGGEATKTTIDSASVQWAKNRVYQRMQLLAKWNPKKYGERLDLTTDGKALPSPQIYIPHNGRSPTDD